MSLPALSAYALPGAGAGERAMVRYVEFFTTQIRNPNTRAAYARAAATFFAWCETLGLGLPMIRPVHVAAWIEQQGRELSAPTVKEQLAAVRMLFDWLVVGQVLPHNPDHAVKGPGTARPRARPACRPATRPRPCSPPSRPMA